VEQKSVLVGLQASQLLSSQRAKLKAEAVCFVANNGKMTKALGLGVARELS
jgi:hypothetical protein